ncbi:MAG: hypothetical protein ACKVTZ_09530 [Bacteroidia bacterium]
MSDYKIFLNRKQPSDEEIQKSMNFDALLNQYQQTVASPKVIEVPFYQRRFVWYSAAAVVVMAMGMFWWMNTSVNDANQTQEVANNEVVTPNHETTTPVSPKTNPETPVVKTPEKTPTKPGVATITTTPTNPDKKDEAIMRVTPPAKTFNADSAIAALPALPPKPVEPEKATSKPSGFNFKKEDFPDIAAYDGVYWAVLDQKISDEYDMTIKDASAADKLFGEKNNWNQTSVKKVSAKEYEVKLARKDGYKATLKMKPVFFGEGYTKAMTKYQSLLAEYNKAVEERKAKEAEFRQKATGAK